MASRASTSLATTDHPALDLVRRGQDYPVRVYQASRGDHRRRRWRSFTLREDHNHPRLTPYAPVLTADSALTRGAGPTTAETNDRDDKMVRCLQQILVERQDAKNQGEGTLGYLKSINRFLVYLARGCDGFEVSLGRSRLGARSLRCFEALR